LLRNYDLGWLPTETALDFCMIRYLILLKLFGESHV